MPLDLTAVTIGAVAAAGPMIAAAADPEAIGLLPLSAGISGSIVTTLKTYMSPHTGEGVPSAGRWGWLPTVVSGVSLAAYGAPAIADWLGMAGNFRTAMLIHFCTGLLGSSLCDVVLSNRSTIIDTILSKFGIQKVK